MMLPWLQSWLPDQPQTTMHHPLAPAHTLLPIPTSWSPQPQRPCPRQVSKWQITGHWSQAVSSSPQPPRCGLLLQQLPPCQ